MSSCTPPVSVFYGLPFAYGLTVTALLLAVGHWFPWPRRLHRLAAYVYGVTAILAGEAIWLITLGRTLIWQGLVAFAIVGGLVTGAAYAIDWYLNQRIRREVERRERHD